MKHRKLEKNIFLNEDNLLRIHLLNGSDVIIRCESNGETIIEFKDEKTQTTNILPLISVKNVN